MEEMSVLLAKSHAGDKEARRVLVEENLGLVRLVVGRFSQRGVETEDLFQIGTIGLIKAIDRFDDAYSVKFSTYAVPLIMGEIRRFLRDDGAIKVSRTVKENLYHIRQAQRLFETKEGREATLEELSEATGLSGEDIVVALDADRQMESIYAPIGNTEGTEMCLLDRIQKEGRDYARGTTGGNGGDAEKEELLNHLLIGQLLDGLQQKEKQLILLRYYENRTQMQVAKELGMSQVSVSRMEKKILQGMKQKVAEGSGSIL